MKRKCLTIPTLAKENVLFNLKPSPDKFSFVKGAEFDA